jgi:hypothetical protein
MPEWLMGADCKSAARATLVQIQLGPFTIKPKGILKLFGIPFEPAFVAQW